MAKRTIEENNRRSHTSKMLMIAGLFSGLVSRTCTHPLERLRILQQTGSPEYKGKGIRQSLKFMYAREGV